jgi:hypothetical protein
MSSPIPFPPQVTSSTSKLDYANNVHFSLTLVSVCLCTMLNCHGLSPHPNPLWLQDAKYSAFSTPPHILGSLRTT